jgi:Ca-activated chloride channel family protein
MKLPASALTGTQGERVALCDVAVSAVLQELLAEVTVSQAYRNDEPVNIEAVYTFPLPLDAVLLDLEVQIGGRSLQGAVVAKAAAERAYEEAIESGDAAVMLEAIEPGLYTMNVGNLLPRETAKITFRYAMLYRWTGERLRFFVPTTIAPRYGDSPHRPHQAPEASLAVENRFALRVEVFGALRDAQFECPTHAVELVRMAEKVVLSLAQPKAVMDRDFVLSIRAPNATRSFALCGQDGAGMMAIASFQPFFPGLRAPRPLALAIVVDCSGSMGGDSIEQAKQALDGILESLQPHDRVTLIAFGSSTKALSDGLLACNQANLDKARRYARSLDADMGGTEIGGALRAAYAALGRTEAADVFLVTDGEVGDWEPIVEEARKTGHRIFTVGVGSAVSEAFVRSLAAATGGACELVSPREGMSERVLRHFARLRAPRARRVAVHWPDGATGIAPARLGAVFEGDTVVACASFARPHAHDCAILEVETEAGEVFRQTLPLPAALPAVCADGLSTVARVAAALRLKDIDDEAAGSQLALRYRLTSPWTNWVVVAPRAEQDKAHEMPALRTVPQTLAAGWGGSGSVSMDIAFSISEARAVPACYRQSAAIDFKPMAAMDAGAAASAEHARRAGLPEPYRRLIELIEADPSRLSEAGALDLLTESGLAADFDEVFRQAASLGLNVDAIAAIVLARLLDGELGELLSLTTQLRVAAELSLAEVAMNQLVKLARQSAELVRLAKAADALLRQESDRDVLRRLAGIPTLFVRLADTIHAARSKLPWHTSDKRAGRQGQAL